MSWSQFCLSLYKQTTQPLQVKAKCKKMESYQPLLNFKYQNPTKKLVERLTIEAVSAILRTFVGVLVYSTTLTTPLLEANFQLV